MENEAWKPFPRQETALRSIAFETLFGGARGPGKTDSGMVWLLKPHTDERVSPDALARYRSLVIRRNSNDLTDWIDRSLYMYHRYGAKLGSDQNSPVIRFPNGSKIRLGHLKDHNAFTKYQGHEYQRMLIEELNQIPTLSDYLKLRASCRSTIDGIDPRVFMTTNFGGVGHTWIVDYFVNVCPWGEVYNYQENVVMGGKQLTLKRSRVFIHATMDDNPVLAEKDPGYVLSIEQLKDTDPELYKSWRFGDPSVFAGQFFKEFRRSKHVIKPIDKPKKVFARMGGMDWGWSAPFAFLGAFIVKVPWTFTPEGYFNRVVIYSEAYGTEKLPKEWGREISSKVNLKEYRYIEADPAMFNKGTDGSISIADQFKKAKREFNILRPGSNDRKAGWVNVHNWLSDAPDGRPYLLITENCFNLIKELPALVHDENDVEDVDTDGVDHASDTCRYLLKSKELKWIDARVGTTKFKGAEKPVIDPKLSLDLKQFEVVPKRRRL